MASVLWLAFITAAEAKEVQRKWRPVPAKPFVLRGTDRRLLDRAERFLEDKHWDDAVGALTRLLEADNRSVVAIGGQRYVSLAEYCQRLLIQLPEEPMAQYRATIDATAEAWWQEGVQHRDSERLRRVVDRYFCSSWGDDALFALGEMALQRGEYQTARHAWLSICRLGNPAEERLTYPDTDLAEATVAARLVLVSIREGDWQRAETELQQFQSKFPRARGRLGGRDVVLADRLATLLSQAQQWPEQIRTPQWRTFAANMQRTNSSNSAESVGPYELLWSRSIENEGLSIFPVVSAGLVIYRDESSVQALSLADGAQVFSAQAKLFQAPRRPKNGLGQPRHTLTVTDRFVFGVTNTPIGPRRNERNAEGSSAVWSLDLQREGAIAWEQRSGDPAISFAGAPIVVGSNAFVSIRSNEQMARAGIACYDLSTGEQRWQRWICQSNTPATGWTDEIVSNLLTYDAGILYANTNLGAIAAVRVADGRIVWLRTYERTEISASGEAHSYYRGPQPCVYQRGRLFVLPTDGAQLLALDASTGRVLWEKSVTSPSTCVVRVAHDRLLLVDAGQHSIDPTSGEFIELSDEHTFIERSTVERDKVPEFGEANLATAGEYVVAAEKNQLSVYFRPIESQNNSNLTRALSKE